MEESKFAEAKKVSDKIQEVSRIINEIENDIRRNDKKMALCVGSFINSTPLSSDGFMFSFLINGEIYDRVSESVLNSLKELRGGYQTIFNQI